MTLENDKANDENLLTEKLELPWKGLLWDIAKAIASISFLVTLVAGLSIFVYLKRIDWPELLLPSISSYAALGIIVVALVLLSFAVAVTFYGSAFWIHIVAHSYGKPGQIPEKLWLLIVLLHSFWTFGVAVFFFSFEWAKEKESFISHIGASLSENFWIVILVFIIAVICTSYLFHRRLYQSLYPQGSSKFILKRIGRSIWDGFQFSLVSLTSSFALSTFFVINPDVGASDINFESVGLVLLSTWPGIAVGLLYLGVYRKKGDAKKSLRIAGIFAIALSFYFLMVFPNFTTVKINMAALGAIAVFSKDEHAYVLTKPEMKSTYEYAGFAMSNDALPIFVGYERFHLADVLLLCKDSYNPLFSPPSEKADGTSGNISSVSKGLIKRGCINVEKGEVRRIDPAVSVDPAMCPAPAHLMNAPWRVAT
jgi:hypothetical protein